MKASDPDNLLHDPEFSLKEGSLIYDSGESLRPARRGIVIGESWSGYKNVIGIKIFWDTGEERVYMKATLIDCMKTATLRAEVL